MSRPPDFDDLVGGELSPGERERLERVHDLLVAAGPPPELPPSAAEPTTESPREVALAFLPRRRLGAALALAAAIALVAFLGGYIAGYRHHKTAAFSAVRTVTLHGTRHAPAATAIVAIGKSSNGNLPMLVTAEGLKRLPPESYYTLALTKHGKPVVTCGTFKVPSAGARTTVRMQVAYDVSRFDGWVVTEYRHGEKAEPVVLKS